MSWIIVLASLPLAGMVIYTIRDTSCQNDGSASDAETLKNVFVVDMEIGAQEVLEKA